MNCRGVSLASSGLHLCTLSPKQSKSRTGKAGINKVSFVVPSCFPGAPFLEQKSPCYLCPLDHQHCDCPRPELKTFWCSQNLLLPCSGSNMGCYQTPISSIVQTACRKCFLAAADPACYCWTVPLQPCRAAPLSHRDHPLPAAHPVPCVHAVLITPPQPPVINTSQHFTGAKINYSKFLKRRFLSYKLNALKD